VFNPVFRKNIEAAGKAVMDSGSVLTVQPWTPAFSTASKIIQFPEICQINQAAGLFSMLLRVLHISLIPSLYGVGLIPNLFTNFDESKK